MAAKRHRRQTTNTRRGRAGEGGFISKLYDLRALKLGRIYRSNPSILWVKKLRPET